MIDPITALAGIQSAVALIKKVSKTVDDVASLGPVLGKYFDAKGNAVKAMSQAKASGKKSSMGLAIEIEMALHQAEQFEKELQFLFMQAGKIDVWNKIKARAMALDVEAAHEARKEKELRLRKKRQTQKLLEIILGITLIALTGIFLGWGVLELISYCQQNGCQ
jgi:hypothetical protein